MKTKGLLNSDLLRVIARMGHGDMIAIGDRGCPFPSHDRTACIDLSVSRGIPAVVDVVKAVLEDLEVEKAIIADETGKVSPRIHEAFLEILSTKRNKGNPIAVEYIGHTEFKDLFLNGSLRGREMKAFVKTGEFTPFANLILVSGVDF
ncbi:MAG: D-ribose pyranase [Planctomycetota bacterium]|jgi:D-ribose pyranase|nr:D-ribose pyranase [Planctomycetota bacterium]